MNIRLLILFFAISFSTGLQAQTANELWSNAQQIAQKENKNVLVFFHASWCGWCKKMEKNMDDERVKKYFDDHYEKVFITVQERPEKKNLETKGGEELLKKLNGEKQGLPFWVILDKEGNVLEDSRVNGENLGAPSSKEEVDEMIKKLQNTSTLSTENLQNIQDVFVLKK